MKTKKCKKKQCQYNRERVNSLEEWCKDYKKTIVQLEEKLKTKIQNEKEQAHWLNIKGQLVQSMAVALESCAHAIADPRRY